MPFTSDLVRHQRRATHVLGHSQPWILCEELHMHASFCLDVRGHVPVATIPAISAGTCALVCYADSVNSETHEPP